MAKIMVPYINKFLNRVVLPNQEIAARVLLMIKAKQLFLFFQLSCLFNHFRSIHFARDRNILGPLRFVR